MKALVYGVRPEPFEVPEDANQLTVNLAHTPTACGMYRIRFSCTRIG